MTKKMSQTTKVLALVFGGAPVASHQGTAGAEIDETALGDGSMPGMRHE